MTTDVAAIDAALAQLGDEVERLDKRVCLLALAAIAHHVRATFPEAVTLGLSWNDYAIHVVPAGYYNAAGELLGQLPEQEPGDVGVFGPLPPDDLLNMTTEPYCSNLKWSNRAVWEPFTTNVHPATGKIIECGGRWLDLTRAMDIPTGIISPATVQAFVDWAEQAGITPEDLDDYVHDLASEPASDTNNGGLHNQVSFMIASCGEDGARDLLVRCEPEEPRPGHTLGTLRSRMAGGYDGDRVNDILGRISQATGVRVVCVWNERDRWSCGGESDFYIEGDDGQLRELAGDLWLWLNGLPDDPDTPHFPGLPASWIGPPTGVGAATLAWHDGEHNYARRDLENGE